MSRRSITLAVSLQWVQMRPIRRLQGRVIGVNGISGVERQRSLRLCLAKHLELGRAIHSILQQTQRLRTPPMQLILLPRLALKLLDPLQAPKSGSFRCTLLLSIGYMTCFIKRCWADTPYFYTYCLQDREQIILSYRW